MADREFRLRGPDNRVHSVHRWQEGVKPFVTLCGLRWPAEDPEDACSFTPEADAPATCSVCIAAEVHDA